MPSLPNLVRTSPLRKVYDSLPGRLKEPYRRLVHLRSHRAWQRHPEGADRARARLTPLEGRFRGCRAVLLGNGPSLRRTELGDLRGEFLIGTNRIYMLAGEAQLPISLYACVNHLVLGQFHHEIRRFPAPLKLLDWRGGHECLKEDPAAVFLPEVPALAFQEDIRAGWSHGYTVTFAALQAAYFLGFSEVILVGVDHRFRASGVAMREVTATGPDADHFSPDYFGRGVQWQLPNLEGSEESYRLARAAFESDGRRILDATVDGALEVFSKVSLPEALKATLHRSARWDGADG